MSGEKRLRIPRTRSPAPTRQAGGEGPRAGGAPQSGVEAADAARREAELAARLAWLEQDRRGALERLRRSEEESRQLASRAQDLERENNDLATLYAAARQLQANLDPYEILSTVAEIVINLIGAERFAIHLVDDESGRLALAVTERGPAARDEARAASELAESALAAGEICCSQDVLPDPSGDPIACIPLRVGGWPLGAVEIGRLLPQKPSLTPLDFELFELIAVHAAAGLLAARVQAGGAAAAALRSFASARRS